MTMVKLRRVDMGSASPSLDRPIWVNSAAIEWFEFEKSAKAYSIVMLRFGESIPVRESPDEILALLAGGHNTPD